MDRPITPPTSGKAIAALLLGISSLFFSVLTALPALLLGLLALSDIGRSKGSLAGKGMAFTGLFLASFSLVCLAPPLGFTLYHGFQFAVVEQERDESVDNLKQLAKALDVYEQHHGSYPSAQGGRPSAGAVPEERELPCSWRVLLLP